MVKKTFLEFLKFYKISNSAQNLFFLHVFDVGINFLGFQKKIINYCLKDLTRALPTYDF